MTLDVDSLEPGQAIATLGPIVIRVIVSSRTEIPDLDRVTSLIDRVLERSSVAGLWVVAHHGAPVPDMAARRYSGRVFRPYGDRLCVAYSLLGLGFWASAANTAVVMIAKLMGMRSPIETTIERGAERLCSELIGIDPNRLLAAHAELLGQIEALGERSTGQPRSARG